MVRSLSLEENFAPSGRARARIRQSPYPGKIVAVSESSARRYALDPDVPDARGPRGQRRGLYGVDGRSKSRLIRVLEHLVGRREWAEDLAQEVFLRVYRAREQYVPGRSSSPGCLRLRTTWRATPCATAPAAPR